MNSRLLDILRRSRSDALRRLGELALHPSIPHRATVARIDDPDGACSILAVRGFVDAATINTLWCEVDDIAATIHLDLTDATILSGPWMPELEALADSLETAGCDVVVVGVDPQHPDLWRPSHPLDPPS